MSQQAAFVFNPIPVNVTVDARDAARLSAQCVAIYNRLLLGPATNDELSRISRKYTSRISEVREWLWARGGDLIASRGDAGLWTYRAVRP